MHFSCIYYYLNTPTCFGPFGPEDGPNGPKHLGVLRYVINILKVHSLEVVIYIRMKMHGKHSIKFSTVNFN
jgi:hypothetical protein